MGDSGSLFLGFYTFYLISNKHHHFLPIIFYLIIFSYYPLIDTSYAFFRRIVKKKNPFTGDKEHIHHKLQVKFNNINANILINGILLLNLVIFITYLKEFNLTNLAISIIIIVVEFLGLVYVGKSKRL